MENPKLNRENTNKFKQANNLEKKTNYPSLLATKETIREILPIAREIRKASEEYLTGENILVDKEKDTEIRKEIFIELKKIADTFTSNNEKDIQKINYDKYKKGFFFEGNKITPGEILSSRRFGNEIAFDENALNVGVGKKLLEKLKEKKIADMVAEKYGKEISKNLAENESKKDMLKSKAYKEINERIGKKLEQFGIEAEQIFIGLLESLSIDRPDLGFNVYEANPWQDVENKIDFILERKNKKRGIGVEESEKEEIKTVGIQFTTALSKREHKLDQIQKAKNKIKDIDDIVYVEIDSTVLRKAISEAEKSNNKFVNPVKFLPEKIKNQILKNLFTGILDEKEIESLNKNI